MSQQTFFSLLFTALLCIYYQNVLSQNTVGGTNERIIYENWLSVQEAVERDTTNTGEPLYDRLSENYYYLYRATSNEIYLNFALHEAGRGKRNEIIERLSEAEVQKVSDLIKVLINRNLDSTYYSIRPFSADDIYTFLIIGIPNQYEEDAKELLDHWRDNLSDTYQEDPIKGAMKVQALIHGYNKLNNFEKVFEVSRFITSSHPFPQSFFTFSLFNTVAYAAKVRGYYSEALNIYEEILFPIAENLGYSDWYLRIKMDYASTLFSIGDVRAALHEFEQVYSQGIENIDPRYRPALLNNLAISYLNAGRFDRYVQFQLEAFEIARREENFEDQLDILRNLFIFYRRQDETELAFNYLSQALELAQENNIQSETTSILLSFGVYKRETQNAPREALDHFFEALDLLEVSDNYQQRFNAYVDLAETYKDLNEFENAENFITDAIALSRPRDDDRNLTQALVRYANMLTETDRFREAQEMMDEVSDDDLQQIPFYIRALGRNVRIKLLTYENNIVEALKVSSLNVDNIIGWLEESTDLQTGHMRMDEEFSEAFRLHTDLLYQQGEYEEALAIIGELRNLSRSGFYNNPLLKSQVLSEEELIRDYHLGNRIEDLRRRYSNANDEQRIVLSNELLDAISERNQLQDQAFPNYQASDYEDTLPSVLRKLDSDQMVLYFSVFENQVFQFFITDSGVDMKAYPAEDHYLDLLNNAVSSLGYGQTNLELLHEVYQTFYESNIPDGVQHIYVIPDGIFYRIPIEILPVAPVHSPNSYGSSNYLIENYSVSYLNTLSDLIKSKPSADFAYDLAGFGVSNFKEAGHPELPDLPFSTREITHSAEMLDKFKQNRFFVNDRSTEENFREVAGKARIIHLATHSKVNDESPLFSSLYLYSNSSQNSADSSRNGNDGIIHAYELFDLNLNAELIFLSSCESGTGGYLKGSGILGFSRAFSYAGAQSLSINLWPIRDQTASEISFEFYGALNEGLNKAEALRKARLSYLNNSNSDPYLWGAFIMYGNIEPPINNNQFLIQLLISGILITSLFFVAVFVYQKKALIKSWIF